jgi:hypothetical protein
MPFHVLLAGSSSLTDFVMSKEVKALDFRSGHMKRMESAPPELLDDVPALIEAAIFQPEACDSIRVRQQCLSPRDGSGS